MHGHLPRVFLALKKHLSSSLEPLHPSYLVGMSLAAWPNKPYRTGCEGPVQSMSARSVHYIRMSVPWSRPLRSGQLHFSRPNTSVATHLYGIIENNKLQT